MEIKNMKQPRLPIVCLSAAEPNGYCSVRIRQQLKTRVDLYTGITVKPEQWDYSRNRVKQGCKVHGVSYSDLNEKINERVTFIENYLNDAYRRNDETACAAILKERYNYRYMRTEKEQSNEFYYLLEKYINDHNSDKHWSNSYHRQWQFLKEDLQAFAPNLTFLTLSESFMRSYIKYLSKRMCDDKIKNYIKKIKEFVNDAQKNKHEINPSFFEYSPKLDKRKKEVNYLTEEELLRIINLDYSASPHLDRVRDAFVFQCCTSLRFSDIVNLTRDDVQINKEGKYEVKLVTQKDKGKVWFPLPELAAEIYDKYKDNPYDDNKAFYICSYTDFLKFLNKIGIDANIEGETKCIKYRQGKEVSVTRKRCKIGTHDARRTFIVQTINGGANWEKIALFTSHSEVEQMKPYVTLTQKGKEEVIGIIDSITKSRNKKD